MNPDIEKLKEKANQLKSVKDREEVLADLKIMEESESNFELLKTEMESNEAKGRKNQLYGSLLMFLTAAITGWYIVHSLISGQIQMSRTTNVSFINEPITFWFFMSFYILVFIFMVFGFISTFPNLSIKRDA